VRAARTRIRFRFAKTAMKRPYPQRAEILRQSPTWWLSFESFMRQGQSCPAFGTS
jgi:hypothetical protein